MTYYAYIHCKPNGTPFYVGKGTFRRASYLAERNSRHQRTVHKYGAKNILIGMFACSTSDIALDLEVGLIKCFRRSKVDLANYTAGGEGTLNPCPESKQRMSEAAKRRGVSQACRQASILAKKGKPISIEQKAKQSAKMKGVVFTEEHRKNISISAKRRGVSNSVLEVLWASNVGRKRTTEEIETRRTAQKKYFSSIQGKQVRILVDGVWFPSISSGARYIKTSTGGILYGLRNSGIVKGHKVEYVI